ncbi:hypothetical protein NVP1081O_201 [Vibrio phage 1.081.O._10N.286.52.C2]|nr:hypothetical protein NVP1081O_201 [Vibrio phage 1.081.O._10N.286.52.C2]
MITSLSHCECPECGQDYAGLSIYSSSELEISMISCSECGFRVEDTVNEDELTEQFLQIYNGELND